MSKVVSKTYQSSLDLLGKIDVSVKEADQFTDVEEGERIVEVIYYHPIYGIRRTSMLYKKGSEKIKGAFHPLVQAVYEKCLGIKVEFEDEGNR
jgi:transcriptional regulator of NAD metabolism